MKREKMNYIIKSIIKSIAYGSSTGYIGILSYIFLYYDEAQDPSDIFIISSIIIVPIIVTLISAIYYIIEYKKSNKKALTESN